MGDEIDERENNDETDEADAAETTLEDQFYDFARLSEHKRSGETITLYRSDYWMRQAKILNDRKLTMTDTGTAFNKFSKTELDYAEWKEFLSDVCGSHGLEQPEVELALTNCGAPGEHPAVVPQYRDYFRTWRHKLALINMDS